MWKLRTIQNKTTHRLGMPSILTNENAINFSIVFCVGQNYYCLCEIAHE